MGSYFGRIVRCGRPGALPKLNDAYGYVYVRYPFLIHRPDDEYPYTSARHFGFLEHEAHSLRLCAIIYLTQSHVRQTCGPDCSFILCPTSFYRT